MPVSNDTEAHVQRWIARLWVVGGVASLLVLPGCDRPGEREQRANDKWERLRDDYGTIPEVQEGDPLERPFPTLVLGRESTHVDGSELPTVPTVTELADAVEGTGDAGVATQWVVWADRSVTVKRLARAVETLRLAAGGATRGGPIDIWLAVDGALAADELSVRGIRLVPFENPELSASNAFAVHDPGATEVSEFLSKFLARRRQSNDRGVEQLSE